MKLVYLEYLILDNFIMNYLLLWVTGRIIKLGMVSWRIAAGSLLGTFYTVFFFLPDYYFLKLLGFKIILSILMIAVGFHFGDLKLFLKTLGTFYGVSFIFGGAAFGLFYFLDTQIMLQNGVFYIHDFPFHLLLISGVFSIFIIKHTWVWVRNRLSQDQLTMEIEIEFDGHMKRIKALLDTGNALYDPITKVPVMVVEFNKIKEILPKEIQEIYIASLENDLDAVTRILSHSPWIVRFRLIPYTSLGKENGMLLGFRPTRIRIFQKSGESELQDVIVGIYAKHLTKEGNYDALMHPGIMTT